MLLDARASFLNTFVLKAGDSMAGDLTFSGAFHPVIAPGSDTDADLLTVTVTGTPAKSWDESEDAFSQNKGLRITAGQLVIGKTTPTSTQPLELYRDGSDCEFLVHEDAGTHDAIFSLRSGAQVWGMRVDAGGASLNFNNGSATLVKIDGTATLFVDQTSTTGAKPCFEMEQRDVDEAFIKFEGEAASGVLTRSLVAVGDVATFTVAGYTKIEVEDDGNQVADQAYYRPFGTLA